MGLSFLPPYGCQGNRTASVAALRMKAREHSEAVLQSANLLGGPGVGVLSGVGMGAAGVARPTVGPAIEVPVTVGRGGDSSSPSTVTKVPVLGSSPDKHPHCSKEPLEKKWSAGQKNGCTDTLNLCDRACYYYSTLLWSYEHLSTNTDWLKKQPGKDFADITLYGCKDYNIYLTVNYYCLWEMLNIWGLVIPMEAQMWFGIFMHSWTLFDGLR